MSIRSPAYSDDIGIDSGSDISSSVGNRKQYGSVVSIDLEPESPPLFSSESDSDVGNQPSPTNVASLYPEASMDDREFSFRFQQTALQRVELSELHQPSEDLPEIKCKDEPTSSYSLLDSRVTLAPEFQTGVTIKYTYETFIATDGRSRRRKIPTSQQAMTSPTSDVTSAVAESIQTGARRPSEECHRSAEMETKLEPVPARYTCSECGRNYATSSNLSRHKQTHRSLTGKHARTCPHCNKPYVSMPALAMHLLTHDLK